MDVFNRLAHTQMGWKKEACLCHSPTPQVAGLENMFEFEHVFSPKRSAGPHRELHHRLTKEEGVREGTRPPLHKHLYLS